MTKRSMLLLLTWLLGAVSAQAQWMPAYNGNNGYPPASAVGAPNPYGYYGYMRPATPPIQPVQYNPYSANNYPPNYNNSRPYYAPNNYGYSNGYGVNYYYMKNPIGYSSTPAPYSAVANQRALEVVSANYPAPAGAPGIYQAAPLTAADDDRPGADAATPVLQYHRTPHDVGWFYAGYVGAIIAPMRLNTPLVTSGSPTDLAPGAIGNPSTAVLFGNNNVTYNILSGVRLEGGLFLDKCDRFSLDWSGFFLFPGTQSARFASDANGNPVLARPIFNVASGLNGALLNSDPTNVAGTLAVDVKSQFAGMEFNARYHDYFLERLRGDVLFGFRYARLAERLAIQEKLTNLAPGFLTFQGAGLNVGDLLTDQDSFETTNNFFGPQIGGHLRYEQTWFDIDGFAKLAMGATQQRIDINGSTSLISPTNLQTTNGGILALPSNIGAHSRTVFSVMPEFGFSVGANLTQCVRLQLGYSLLLWSHVARPGSQIDTNVNPGQIPGSPNFGAINGPLSPSFRFSDEFFWSHNFQLGLEVHF